ncbi:MAG TPA: DUF4214 domain-containing protein [Noviherbaspirillum sp.]
MANTITGTKGNDTFDSYITNDVFDGGTGTDTMVFNGPRSNFTITRTADGYSITDTTGAEGKDELRNIELIKFSDTTLDIEYYDVVQQLYVAYFGRATDSAALINFAGTLKSYGASSNIQELNTAYANNAQIRDLIDTFGTSAESNALYTGDTTSFVTAVFQNVLNRPPQTDGLTFWRDAIDEGRLTKANAALAIMAGALANTSAQGVLDAALINNKIRVATNFTCSIDTASEMNGYRGSGPASMVRSMLANVTSSTDVEAFQATVESTLSSMAGSSGASPQGHQDAGILAQLVGVSPGIELL